ncbi:MAG TPA: hypothetical protein VFE25_00275 [Opitutaceae bacterium]|jgi:hypothetical protein|nr:hypothetical protein [Opitutaceae bacterium]
MMTSMIIAVLLLLLAGLFTVLKSFKRAALGYEDEFGFHPGSDREETFSQPEVGILEVEQKTLVSEKKTVRAPRPKLRKAPVSLDHGPTPTFQI